MAKIKTSVVFKQYSPAQNFLLPPSLDELIGQTHLVRVVNQVVETMNISSLINQYEGGGTSAYHPRMLLKVLLYAYCSKIYTGRKIAKALSQDIHFMWLAGMNRPDFRTINNFRSSKAKQAIEDLFKEMLMFLVEHRYIKMENYFCDGSTFAADGNRHKMVWKKNADKYKEGAEQKCKDLFRHIDLLNAEEEKTYGNNNLEETGTTAKAITTELIERQVTKLNKIIETTTTNKQKRKAESIKKKLQQQQDKIVKYQHQQQTAGNRSGYNRTDKDASAMRMKNKETLPAYNVMAGSENQFIVNCSVHQNGNDASCFKDHIEQLEKHSDILPENINADSIFGTEENYEVLEGKEINNYVKFPSFHKEERKTHRTEPFSNRDFSYNGSTDSYTCPNQQLLIFKKEIKQDPRRSGYQATVRVYECKDCNGCAFYEQCCTPKKEKNRTIQVNMKLEAYKQQARENLRSEKGWQLRRQRGVEIESCFADIKHNMGLRRFHLRGLQKVKTEFTIVAIAHNLRKIYFQNLKKTA